MSTSTLQSDAATQNGFVMTERDRELILATQAGLPLVSEPLG